VSHGGLHGLHDWVNASGRRGHAGGGQMSDMRPRVSDDNNNKGDVCAKDARLSSCGGEWW
jgi:hypothetical protein